MGTYFNQAGISVSGNYLRQLIKLLTIVTLLFLSCNNETDKEKSTTSSDSTKREETNSGSGKQAFTGDPLLLPRFKVSLTDLKNLPSQYKKIIIRIYYSHFPDTTGMVLKIYPAKNNEHDGTGEITIKATRDLFSEQLSTGNFSFGNSHAELSKLIAIGNNVDSLVLVPKIGIYGVENYLGFTIGYYTPGASEPVLNAIELSNPCPPAPPGNLP